MIRPCDFDQPNQLCYNALSLVPELKRHNLHKVSPMIIDDKQGFNWISTINFLCACNMQGEKYRMHCIMCISTPILHALDCLDTVLGRIIQ